LSRLGEYGSLDDSQHSLVDLTTSGNYFNGRPLHSYNRHDPPDCTARFRPRLRLPPSRIPASYLFLPAFRVFSRRKERRRGSTPINNMTVLELLQ
jgi:hypothetical protein